MRIEARGLNFDVRLGGPDSAPAALLLHGFPQHSGEWELVAPTLHAAGIRTVALDQRGYSPGARPAEVSAYRIAEPVADALAVLDALGLAAAHVVGHDWGAVVGWHLASRHPDRLRTLTAVSVPHPLAMAAALATDPDQRRRSAYIGLFREGASGTGESSREGAGKAERVLLAGGAARLRAMLTGVPVDRREAYLAPIRDPGATALTAALSWYRAMSRTDLDGLGAVGVPTTYVWSDQDIAVGRTAALACAKYVTGDYRFVELAGVSHWVPDEAPGALADAIVARVGEDSAAPGATG